MRRSHIAVTIAVWILAGSAVACSSRLPLTPGDPLRAPVYGYTPLDPIPVDLNGETSNDVLLKALPDETIRIAVGEISGQGTISFGPTNVGYQGRSYEVILDYVKFTTKTFPATITGETSGTRRATLSAEDATPDAEVPVYVGVGLRMKASITVHQGEVNLGNLVGIGAAAAAGRVTGTLVVQTLGISGAGVTALIPVPGKIDDSTIQNAMVALGSIKARLYDTGTVIIPRVVGVYNTLGGGQETINAYISTLLQKPIALNAQTGNVTRVGGS
jgi:hypothetical protein